MKSSIPLIEYLETNSAVRAIGKLLSEDCPRDDEDAPVITDGAYHWTRLDNTVNDGGWDWSPHWTRIDVSTAGAFIRCYLRTIPSQPDDHSSLGRVIVSDCGELITHTVKHRGIKWSEAVYQATMKTPMIKEHGEIMSENAATQSAQTVAWVLAAIAKVLG